MGVTHTDSLVAAARAAIASGTWYTDTGAAARDKSVGELGCARSPPRATPADTLATQMNGRDRAAGKWQGGSLRVSTTTEHGRPGAAHESRARCGGTCDTKMCVTGALQCV